MTKRQIQTDMAEYVVKVAKALEEIDKEYGDDESTPFVMKVTFGQYREEYTGLTLEPNDFGGYDLGME